MAEPRPLQRSPQSPSYIPVVTPRPPRSTLPSSLSVPQLGLVPPTRRASGSNGSPSQSTPPSTVVAGGVDAVPTPNPNPNNGLSSFRSLKSFLPFVSSKQPPSGGTPTGLKSPFSGFGSVRRSITGERKMSGSYVTVEPVRDVPVISIDHSPVSKADSSPSSSDTDYGPPVVTYTPDPPLSTELSTIIESDLSGLSKHLPALDDSMDSSFRLDFDNSREEDTRVTLLPQPTSAKSSSSRAEPHDTTLDLSTSKLSEEVLQALRGKRSGGGWFAGTVVEDAQDSRPGSSKGDDKSSGDPDGDPDSSFHLDTLDPDLAALLSPNRITDKQSGLRIPPEGIPTPSITPPPPSDAPARIFSSSRLYTPQSTHSNLSSPTARSPISITGSSDTPSSPKRPLAPSAFSRPSISRGPSVSSVPRFMRSVTDRTSPLRADKTLTQSFTSRAASDPVMASPYDEGRRASSDSVFPRRPAPPSPLSPEPAAPLVQHHTGGETYRRPAASRLATPARSTLYASTSRTLRPATASASTSPGTWDGDSTSPSSRASSALGSAPSARRVHRTRPSMETEHRPSFERERTSYLTRNRKRSMSVGEQRRASPLGRPLPEWIGPKTAKAFAAAGLLDRERDRERERERAERERERERDALGSSYSRFGSVRSTEYRSQHNASRMAFSEAGSAASSSWRSVSRTMTASEAGGPLESARTTFSGGSTAPTSISGASSPQQTLQDKHAMETGTLLAALADSQRAAQALREENARLSARVDELEAQLVDAHAQLRKQQSPQPLARAVLDRMANASERRLGSGHLRTASSSAHSSASPRPSLSLSNDEREDVGAGGLQANDGYRAGARKRVSGASAVSVFALPPSNMSLLMHEDAGSAAGHSQTDSMRSVTPPPQAQAQPRHVSNQLSMSSAGNISPTTASFSMTDVAGSPGSLYLRPEHELHLGDMASLDLRFGDGEDEEEEE